MDVLVVVDMQKDFISGALGTKEAIAIVPRVAEKIAQAKKSGKLVVFTRDTHHENYLETQEGRNLPVPHCIENTDGWQIDPALDTEGSPVVLRLETGTRLFALRVQKVFFYPSGAEYWEEFLWLLHHHSSLPSHCSRSASS